MESTELYPFLPIMNVTIPVSNVTMGLTASQVFSIVVNSILMLISGVGNITVLVITWRRRSNTQCRINTMLIHLAIADLLVTFILIPIEIFTAATPHWLAGDACCRIVSFFRTFGLYQSSFVIVCISIDRYLAVLKPMRFSEVESRGKIMLTFAWIASVICSIPQIIVFRAEQHPFIMTIVRCVAYDSLPIKDYEFPYFMFTMMMMCGLPLIIIMFSYGSIVAEIYRKSKEPFQESSVRRSFLERAKSRTLKMTIVIVLAFFICWTPYHVISFWFWIDERSYREIDSKIKKGLYIFACTNSSINPIVYGMFNIRRNNPGTSCTKAAGTNNSCTTAIKMSTHPEK